MGMGMGIGVGVGSGSGRGQRGEARLAGSGISEECLASWSGDLEICRGRCASWSGAMEDFRRWASPVGGRLGEC
jgi:hypothetical protein